MQPDLPPAMPYEPTRDNGDVLFWRLFRLGMIVWPAIVLVRHGSYWTDALLRLPPPTRSGAGGVGVGLALAVVESLLLVLVLTVAASAKVPSRRTLRALGILAAGLILVGLVNLGISVYQNLDELRLGSGVISVIWMIASRTQLLVMPLLAILAWLRWRGPDVPTTTG